MSRRREPDRSSLPPPDPIQAEIAQSKAFEDRDQAGPPAKDVFVNPDGTVKPSKKPGDSTPANDVNW